MSSWKCIFCGTGILSKCPGQRSEFFNPRISMIQSVVTVDRIDYAGTRLEGSTELMLTYTAGSEYSTVEIVRNLATMLAEDGVIESLTCDHRWVLNSETECHCSLGHEHHNLTDAERIKTEILAARPERTLLNTTHELAEVACTPVELARKAINCSKEKYDSFIESEFGHLKADIRGAVKALTEGKTLRKEYRVLVNGPSSYRSPGTWLYTDDTDVPKYAYFDRLSDVKAMACGLNQHIDIARLSMEDDSGYRPVDYELTTTCEFCGKSIDLLQPHISGTYHVDCYGKHLRKLKPRKRYISVPLPASIADARRKRLYYDLTNLERDIQELLNTEIVIDDACISQRTENGPEYLWFNLTCTGYEADEFRRNLKDIH